MNEMGGVSDDECRHLGMTFSFPVEQTALGAGRLLTWTKGFSATGAIGEDVVQLLQDSLDKKKVACKCVALVNDVSSSRTRIGVEMLTRSDRPSEHSSPGAI